MIDITPLTTWVAIIAIASLLQSLMLLGGAFMAWRSIKQGQQALERLERQHLVPLVARVNDTIGDVRDVTARVRQIDDDVRRALTSSTEKALDTAARVKSTAWPALALGRAVHEAVSSFRRHRSPGRPSSAV
jgi:CHASE1-domain containing sensor protein